MQGPPGIGIEKLEQTYTAELPSEDNIITLTRSIGDQFTFKVKNGVGVTGIETLQENNISSNENQYRIHLSNNTYQDIAITNGVGITNIVQQNLADGPAGINTITINLSDGTSHNIQLRNGQAGGIIDVAESNTKGFITITNADGTEKDVEVGSADAIVNIATSATKGFITVTNAEGTSTEVGVGTALSLGENTTATKVYVLGTTGPEDMDLKYNSGVYVDCSNGVLYGAAWNDYAEYRDQNEIIKPGYITYCDDDGKLKLTTKRLQKFEGVVSDTYGFSIGETDQCKTPIAVSGRVLVYTNPEDIFHAGDCVCAGPNGLAHYMTREEIVEFPDRIVGIVSEIPTYETWNNVNVNGRIWIKVK